MTTGVDQGEAPEVTSSDVVEVEAPCGGSLMLNKLAFASSLAILSGLLYFLFYVLGVLWRDAFRFLFNAQFFGADVASLLPHELSYVTFLGTWIAVIVSTWVVGYAWAWLYNRLSAFVKS
jgi:2TM family of unknown function (DUF5676)